MTFQVHPDLKLELAVSYFTLGADYTDVFIKHTTFPILTTHHAKLQTHTHNAKGRPYLWGWGVGSESIKYNSGSWSENYPKFTFFEV